MDHHILHNLKCQLLHHFTQARAFSIKKKVFPLKACVNFNKKGSLLEQFEAGPTFSFRHCRSGAINSGMERNVSSKGEEKTFPDSRVHLVNQRRQGR